jgi:hypothetical protein
MFSYGYTSYQAERAKTQAEQREADAQLGQLLAALAQLLGSLAKPVRALRRQSGTESPAGEHARHPAAGAICQMGSASICTPSRPGFVTHRRSRQALNTAIFFD